MSSYKSFMFVAYNHVYRTSLLCCIMKTRIATVIIITIQNSTTAADNVHVILCSSYNNNLQDTCNYEIIVPSTNPLFYTIILCDFWQD